MLRFFIFIHFDMPTRCCRTCYICKLKCYYYYFYRQEDVFFFFYLHIPSNYQAPTVTFDFLSKSVSLPISDQRYETKHDPHSHGSQSTFMCEWQTVISLSMSDKRETVKNCIFQFAISGWFKQRTNVKALLSPLHRLACKHFAAAVGDKAIIKTIMKLFQNSVAAQICLLCTAAEKSFQTMFSVRLYDCYLSLVIFVTEMEKSSKPYREHGLWCFFQ